MMNQDMFGMLLAGGGKHSSQQQEISLPKWNLLMPGNMPSISRHAIVKQLSSSPVFSLKSDVRDLIEIVPDSRLVAPQMIECKSKIQKRVMQAARNNNHSMLEIGTAKLYPSDVNTIDMLGNTPLHYAAKHGNRLLCAFLLEKGAFVNVQGQELNTPLHNAYLSGSAPVFYCDPERGNTP